VVVSPDNDLEVDAPAKAAIIDEVRHALNEIYVFPEKAEAMETRVRRNLQAGKYDSIERLGLFTTRLAEVLRSVCRDRHLAVFPSLPPQSGDEGGGAHPVEFHEFPELNVGMSLPYRPRVIRLEKGALYYQRENRSPFRLQPMGDDRFLLEGIDDFRIQFRRDDSGAVTHIAGQYEDGGRDANARTPR
jgi:hypothetical protein